MKPTVGRIVHYTTREEWKDRGDGVSTMCQPSYLCPAIVCGVNEDGTCTLYVCCMPSNYYVTNVECSDFPAEGCWNWPPREGK